MKYNYKEIGDRIRTERKKKYKSQDAFIEALKEKDVSIGRSTLSNIENGEIHDIKFSVLLAMCELFECTMIYLLGDSLYMTKEKSTAGKLLGLSPKALDGLINLSVKSKPGIQYLLENHDKSIESLLFVFSILPAIYGNGLKIITDPTTGKQTLSCMEDRYDMGIKELETHVRDVIEKEINYKDYLGIDIPPELLPKKQ